MTNGNPPVQFDMQSAKRIANLVRQYEQGVRYLGPPVRKSDPNDYDGTVWAQITDYDQTTQSYSWKAIIWDDGGKSSLSDVVTGTMAKDGMAIELNNSFVSNGVKVRLIPTSRNFYLFQAPAVGGIGIAQLTSNLTGADESSPGSGSAKVGELSNGEYHLPDGAKTITIRNGNDNVVKTNSWVYYDQGTGALIQARCADTQ